jgi:hypothetical protein
MATLDPGATNKPLAAALKPLLRKDDAGQAKASGCAPGLALRVESARMAANPPIPMGVMQASVPPQTMMSAGYYHPYRWTVRHFRPGETRETILRFTPRGDPYGFAVKLPENEAGAALESGPAREIAEQTAARDWQIDLGKYRWWSNRKKSVPVGASTIHSSTSAPISSRYS